MSWLIYKHVSPSGKVYIGQTQRTVDERWRNGQGYTHNKNTRFSKAIQKYGWAAFKHEIIEDSIETQEEANARERYWIAQYNSYDFDHGYNMTLGGYDISPDVRDKARDAVQKKKREEFDLIYCYERQKFFINPKVAFEWFISNGYSCGFAKNPIVRVLDQENHTCFGYHFCRAINLFTFRPVSQDEVNKNKGRKRRIICVDTGDVYDSISDCSRTLGIKVQHLCKACKNHTPTHKLFFAYLEDYNEHTWQKYQREKTIPSSAKSVYCIELDKKWVSGAECCRELHISDSAMFKLLSTQDSSRIYRTIQGKHFCYFYEKEYATIVDRPTTRIDSRAVYRITTKDSIILSKERFNSITEAERTCHVKNILKCCQNWKYTAGGSHWCFAEDIDKFKILPQIERKYRNHMARRVINDVGDEYDTVTDASKAIHRDVSALCKAIKNGTKCAGHYWRHID